jgi:hypothetical protein
MTDTNTSTKNRRTDLEIQEAVSFALQHIELGMSRTTVQQMLCSKFCYPMKTARRDYLLAMDEYGSAGITVEDGWAWCCTFTTRYPRRAGALCNCAGSLLC